MYLGKMVQGLIIKNFNFFLSLPLFDILSFSSTKDVKLPETHVYLLWHQ